MIAHVIPLTRLPARFSFFDYLIPQELEVIPGDLVLISFRGIVLQGIVCGTVAESTHKKLSTLKSVIRKNVFSQKDIERFLRISQKIGQSPSTLMHATLPKHIGKAKTYKTPPSPAKKSPSISSDELPALQELVAFIKNHPHAALQGDFETGIALAHILGSHLTPPSQLLILVPRDRDADILRTALKHNALAVVTGTTPEADRAAIFCAWQEGKIQVLIGTKQIALWNAHALTHVLVLHAGNDEYANHRRNPKFDPREAARLLAQQHGAHYVSTDTLPRIEDCTEKHWTVPFFAPDPQELIPFARFIPLAARTEKTAYPLITLSLEEAIKTASQSQKRVLLFLNRKGAAKRLQCAACDYVPICGTCGNIPTVRAAEDLLCDRCQTEMWIPEACPSCQKARLKFVGVGGEKVVVDLKKLFPHLSIGFVEKGSDVAWKNADIVVATEHVFANLLTPFTRHNFGLVADLMADLPVGGVDFRASEHTSRQLLRLLFLAKREKAECLIQTWIPARLPDLIAPAFVITEELRVRQEYKLPPFGNVFITKTGTIRNPANIPDEPFVYDGKYDVK